MKKINEERFFNCLEQFRIKILEKQKALYKSASLSFSEGYLREQEWYKHDIFEKSQEILDLLSWTEDDIGTGFIAEKIIEIFHVEVSGNKQNIIDWRDIERAEEIIQKHPKRAGAFFYELFCKENDEKSFKSAVELFGKRYPVITYLFFIKDKEKYVPVRPNRFQSRFEKLGITTDSLSSCSWENYQEFLEIIRWVQKAVEPVFSNISLLDAHSFIWMIWMLELDEDTNESAEADEGAVLIGSPNWFFGKSQTKRMADLNKMIEERRASFIENFSPKKLALMDGNDLLNWVFSDAPSSMMRLLMFDEDYRWFGAAGKYKYLGVLYQGNGTTWVYKEGNNSQTLSRIDAEQKAKSIRDNIISCVNEIENIGVFHTLQDYQRFQNQIKRVFFYKYPWMMKYYQMIYPQFFPSMYADKTLNRALQILGLPNHGTAERLLNAGEISLFIRKCDVNNIVFNQIYDDEWGWESDCPPCQNAAKNYHDRLKPVEDFNTIFYITLSSNEEKKKERTKEAEDIEQELSSIPVEGKEKEAVVRVRVNQGEFRDRLLKKYGKCCLCGVSNPTLLRASHIKPWSASEPEEKLDENNGFLLCPNHDILFDSGLITFEDSGSIVISDKLDRFDRILMNVNDDMKIKNINNEQASFLKYHRENVFNR